MQVKARHAGRKEQSPSAIFGLDTIDVIIKVTLQNIPRYVSVSQDIKNSYKDTYTNTYAEMNACI